MLESRLYRKVPKFSDARKLCCNLPKIQTKRPNLRVFLNLRVYIDSTLIPLLPKSELSSLGPSSVAIQPGLCRTWFETRKTAF